MVLLQSCLAVPTLIVPNTVLQPPLLQPFLAALLQHLQAAGVPNIHLPSQAALQQHYIKHLYQDLTDNTAGSSCQHAATQAAADHNASVDGAALLQQSCNWLPAAAAAAESGQITEGAHSSLPLPIRALLAALVDHLKQHLAQPKVRTAARPEAVTIKAVG